MSKFKKIKTYFVENKTEKMRFFKNEKETVINVGNIIAIKQCSAELYQVFMLNNICAFVDEDGLNKILED